MKPPTIKSVILQGIVGGVLGCGLFLLVFHKPLLAQMRDPSPRFQLLGRELLDTPNTAAPAKVFVYVDKATHDEIVCFSGENRETLSCYRSGRQR